MVVAPDANAKPDRSGSSAAEGFGACVKGAVLGRQDGACEGRESSPPCIGLRRALENSALRTNCIVSKATVCFQWGHDGRTQAEWVSIAAAHLATFGGCVKQYYGSENSSGTKEALADGDLVARLQRTDDGSGVFRLDDGSLLLGALHEDRFGYLIQHSPFAKGISGSFLELLLAAADRPATFPPESYNQAYDEGNPASEGESLGWNKNRNPETAPEDSVVVNPGPLVLKPRPVGEPRRPASTPRKAAAAQLRARPNPYSLGLDLSLFQRVNFAYQRRWQELQGMDDYVRAQRIRPPADLGELLKAGGSL
jgi:hypothetical protein